VPGGAARFDGMARRNKPYYCGMSDLTISRLASITARLVLGALAVFGLGCPESARAADTSGLPNILLILADDLGWKDVGYHGSEIETPHIDRIAREGVELDRFYAQPTCSPTRSALMTGKSPMRLGIIRPISKNQRGGLPLEETILPQYLARFGYQPLMVGKWHLGHYTPDYFPQARGFEHFYGHVTGGIGYWDHNHGGGHDWQRNGQTIREEGYSTRLLADEAIRVLESRDRSRPTFFYVAFNAPHLPNEAPDESIAKHATIEAPNRRIHAAMVSELDSAIGRVLGAFESEGMLGNTIVLFSSDNGGLIPGASPPGLQKLANLLESVFGRPVPIAGLEFLVTNVNDGGSDNDPLAGGKGSVAEGGSRVPAAIWWPGHLEGGTRDGFMTMSDVLPTLLDAIGAENQIPTDLDGRSQWAALRGDATGSATSDYVTTGYAGMALYRTPWKLIDPKSPRLYHIYDDPLEEKDLAADRPEIVEELVAAAKAWPRGPESAESMLDILMDPDAFGGVEDREPWADVARKRATHLNQEKPEP
jgi:arylsulfatase A-like enzyme